MTLRIDHGALTHEGRVRAHNEDSFAALPAAGVFAVADGMGGFARGDWASAVIVEAIGRATLPDEPDAALAALAGALHEANAAIWTEGERRGEQIGTTAVVLLLRHRRFAVLWVGDSRAYVSRRGRLVRLTQDHTQVQEMVDRGLLAPADAATHPMRHVLARALGVQPVVEVDVVSDVLEPGDVFLLCSDGLTARVSEEEIGAVLARHDHDDGARRLVELTLARGAPDNVTVVTAGTSLPTARDFSRVVPAGLT